MTTYARTVLAPGGRPPAVRVQPYEKSGIGWVEVDGATVQSQHADLLEALGDAFHLAARDLRALQEDLVAEPIGAGLVADA